MVMTHNALAPLCARHAQLEALTVAFDTTRAFACATFSVLHGLFVATNFKLFHEGLWVALCDICLRSSDVSLASSLVEAICAVALRFAESALRKALAIELQAARLGAVACFGQNHRLNRSQLQL